MPVQLKNFSMALDEFFHEAQDVLNMKDVMGIIYTGENDARLRELTIIRAIAALPVAGRFRVIDFLVSSMVNGGMKNIGVIMQKNYVEGMSGAVKG